MNSHHIFSALIALTCLAISQSADAMYHTRLGRFIQRDPTGYPDGMNTYAGYHILHGGVDPMGNLTAKSVGEGPQTKRMPGRGKITEHIYVWAGAALYGQAELDAAKNTGGGALVYRRSDYWQIDACDGWFSYSAESSTWHYDETYDDNEGNPTFSKDALQGD